MDRSDMWMIYRRQEFCRTLESRNAFGIPEEFFRKTLDRDLALQLRIARAIQLAPPAPRAPTISYEPSLVPAVKAMRTAAHYM